MAKRIFQIAVALVVLFGTLTPLANSFDTWDNGAAAAPVNDTEIHLTYFAAFAGLVLVMTDLALLVPPLSDDPHHIDSARGVPTFSSTSLSTIPEPTGSPPLVALRI